MIAILKKIKKEVFDNFFILIIKYFNNLLNKICLWMDFWMLSVENEVFTHMNATLTYLLTPWSRVLLEKLTGSAASQQIPRIFGTRSFLTVPTSARHLSLSWANSIQSPQLPLPEDPS
jgi:hypothetical protein